MKSVISTGNMSITGTSTNSYAYTGREFDGLGIDYYRARYYNPQTGRFISEDPIGLAAGTQEGRYEETSFTLASGETLTFVSDGVVEAKSATGELFGFERTREISNQSAEQIAQAAQAFGQQDDITVLTLVFEGAAAPSARW